MKNISVLALIFGLCMMLPTTLTAESGQRFNVDGYSVHVSVTKLSHKLLVTGSVKGGESCDNLQISCWVKDENGRSDRINISIQNNLC